MHNFRPSGGKNVNKTNSPTKKINDNASPEIRPEPPTLKFIQPSIPKHSQQSRRSTKNNTDPNTGDKTIPALDTMLKTFKCIYLAKTLPNTSRIQIANEWIKIFPTNKDIIIQSRQGFIIKSNNNKNLLTKALENLKTKGTISDYAESTENTSPNPNARFSESYSAVISDVEIEIEEQEIATLLNTNQIKHRYCKRIISKKTNRPSLFIRIITGDITSYEKLINEGIFYKTLYN
ncbi:hypothetical protein WA026_004888 [Henosepilachna vigintioctopunctata]|uniref:Uncharacterized protein n=1 Tax=Henosepilachna vigintioctopunctata TaxID=420089 RepID=A0AAW1USB5_9CUCU